MEHDFHCALFVSGILIASRAALTRFKTAGTFESIRPGLELRGEFSVRNPVKKWPFGQGIDPISRVGGLHASLER
jgi:hypothetical protein